MVNTREVRKALEAALVGQEPQRLAQTFELPIDRRSSKSGEPRKYNKQSLVVDGKDCGNLLTALVDSISAAEVVSCCRVDSKKVPIVIPHLTSFVVHENVKIEPTIMQSDFEATFESQTKVHSAFNRLFSSSEGNWMIPAMIVVCKTTNKLAMLADHQASLKSKTSHHQANLQKAVPILQDSYSKTFNDRTEFQPGAPFDNVGSKQAGVLAIVNELFEMYFRLNILRLCKNLIRPVETKKLSEKGSMAEMVTYRYYLGRLSMFEDQHSSAETHLEFALLHCHKNATTNKKRILKYLIPVKLYRGRLPTSRREFCITNI